MPVNTSDNISREITTAFAKILFFLITFTIPLQRKVLEIINLSVKKLHTKTVNTEQNIVPSPKRRVTGERASKSATNKAALVY